MHTKNKHITTILLSLCISLFGFAQTSNTLISEDFVSATGVPSNFTSVEFSEDIYVVDPLNKVGKLTATNELYSSNITTLTKTCPQVVLTFDHLCFVNDLDLARIQYKVNGSLTWITLTDQNYLGNNSSFIDGFSVNSYPSWAGTPSYSNSNLKTEIFSIPGLEVGDALQIRFLIEDFDGNRSISAGEGWFIDNITLVESNFDYANLGFDLEASQCNNTDINVSGLNLPPCVDPNDINWSFSLNGGVISHISHGYTPLYTFTTLGSYTIYLSIANHTVSQITQVHAQNAPLTFSFGTNCGDVSIASSYATPLINPAINYGDGYFSNTYNPNHTYLANGTYTVTVTADNLDCPLYGVVTINTLPESDFSYTILDNCDATLDVDLTINNYDNVLYNYIWNINGQSVSATGPTATYTQNLQLGANVITLSVLTVGNLNCLANSSKPIYLGGPLHSPLFTNGATDYCVNDLLIIDNLTPTADDFNWTITAPSSTVMSSNAIYPQYVLTQSGIYTIALDASMGGCATVSTSTTVTVLEEPQAVFTMVPSATSCGTYTLSFVQPVPASFTSIDIDYGDGNTENITPGSGTLSGSHLYATNGIYTVVATITNGSCTDTYQQNVHVTDGATLTLSATQNSVCIGANTQLEALLSNTTYTGNIAYEWSFNGIVDPTLGSDSTTIVSAAGVYTVGITGTSNVCLLTGNTTASITIGQAFIPSVVIDNQVDAGCGNTGSVSLDLSGIGIDGYVFNGNPSTASTQLLENLSAGSYYFTFTAAANPNCFSTIPVNILGSDLAVSANLINASNCDAPTGSIGYTSTGGVNPISYTLLDANNTAMNLSSINGLDAGTYYIEATDANGCSASASVIVPYISVNFSVSTSGSGQLCANNSGVSITATATSPDALSYEWFDGQGTSINLTDNLGINATGTYTVTGTLNGCEATESITIKNASPVSISIATDGQQCAGDDVEVTAMLNGGVGAITWSASNGASVIPDPQNDALAVVNLNAAPTTITATVSNAGCSYTSNALNLLELTAPQNDLPNVDGIVSYIDTNSCELTCQAIGGTAPYTFNWYLEEQAVTTYGYPFVSDPTDPNDPYYPNNTPAVTQTATNVSVLQVSFAGNQPGTNPNSSQGSTSSEYMEEGSYTYEIVDANGCIVSYTNIKYVIPENVAAFPAFSFVYEDINAEKEEEVEKEIDQALRENMAEAANEVMTAAGKCHQQQMQATLTDFKTSCFDIHTFHDKLSLSYDENIYHYTLFYYDRAGMLTKTVPPEGVDVLDSLAVDAIYDYRTADAATIGQRLIDADALVSDLVPDHKLESKYWYNNLGQMIRQETPDGGVSSFIYDALNRLRFSQNQLQAQNDQFSYIKYDALGRTVEAGQSGQLDFNINQTNDALNFKKVFKPNNSVAANDNSYPDEKNEQITFSVYNTPAQVDYYGQAQRYLLNRISYIYSDYDGDLTTVADQYHTYYSYDAHGNVEWLVQEDPEIGKNYLAYEYDLISGKVLNVTYNKLREDRFFHRYHYDEENRLTSVETSTNGELWDQDASYEYYAHGPLKRTVIGEDQVQGIDYTYTLQGWLKGVNQAHLAKGTLNPDNDGANAGVPNVGTVWNTTEVAKDVFGMSLGYYQGDYWNSNRADLSSSSSGTGIGNNLYASTDNLYNGNISHWINSKLKSLGTTAIEVDDFVNATVYKYDILNRIKGSKNYNFSKTIPTTTPIPYFFDAGYDGNGNPDAYKTSYVFDGNGNLLFLNRFDENEVHFDKLEYFYNNNTPGGRLENNKLAGVTEYSQAPHIQGRQDITDKRLYNQTTAYDKIGNLIHDKAFEWYHNNLISADEEVEVIMDIEWNVSGKIKAISESITSISSGNVLGFKYITYAYDALGNRTKQTSKIKGVDFTNNLNSAYTYTPEDYDYSLVEIKSTYYVRDAQGNPMGTYSKKYIPDGAYFTAEIRVQEHQIYGSDRVGLFKTPNEESLIAKQELIKQEEGEFTFSNIDAGAQKVSEYQNWITATNNKSTLTASSNDLAELCECNIEKIKHPNGGPNYLDDGTLASFIGITNNGVAIAENLDGETQFYAVLAKDYLGVEDACLVYDKNGMLMKGLQNIENVDPNSKPVIVNITGTNKYALITLTNDGTPTYHIIDMNSNGYGTVGPVGEVVTANLSMMQTNPATANDLQYGWHYTGYEDHINNRTIVYTTRSSSLQTNTDSRLIEVIAIEMEDNAPVQEYVLYAIDECGDAKRGELQIAPNGQKLIWYSHSQYIGAFDYQKAIIYEIELGPDKISAINVTPKQTLADGNYAPLSGIEYTENSEDFIYSQSAAYTNTASNQSHKTWKYDALNASILSIDPTSVYLLGEIKRGVNGKLYIPNLGATAPTMNSFTTTDPVAVNLGLYNSDASSAYTHTSSLPTQVFKLYGNNINENVRPVGFKYYELKDHLGNVRAVITDEKIVEDVNSNETISSTDYFAPHIVSYSDYYPYGMLMPGRHGEADNSDYRYGFQGQEKDDEIKGKGNSLNYKYRMHDSRLGRFFAVDPLSAEYPHNSPYAFSENSTIAFVELEGLEKAYYSLSFHNGVPKLQLLKIDLSKNANIIEVQYQGESYSFNKINGQGLGMYYPSQADNYLSKLNGWITNGYSNSSFNNSFGSMSDFYHDVGNDILDEWSEGLSLIAMSGAGRSNYRLIKSAQLKQKYQIGKKRNIAWLEGGINGKGIQFVASSGQHSQNGTVAMAKNRKFKANQGSNKNAFDSEMKLFEAFSNKYPAGGNVKGELTLFSQLPMCSSCQFTYKNFVSLYPNVTLTVYDSHVITVYKHQEKTKSKVIWNQGDGQGIFIESRSSGYGIVDDYEKHHGP